MATLKKVLLVILVLLVLAVGGAYLIPSTYQVERSVVIQADPQAIFPMINNLKRWEEWTPWTTELDPSMKREYDGPPEGVGAKMWWTGEKLGNGSVSLLTSSPPLGVGYSLELDASTHKSHGKITFALSGDGTEVKWTHEGTVGMNPIHRYGSLMMGRMMGSDFEKGLAKLKQNVEKKP
ncbi:MAG TPA: SRPBCC family protein [Planctomycetota bacterium]|nr:SRPBCC family protein [Planctomycetota bacterium]